MGGHGAFYLAFRNQDIWAAAGSMSGGVDIVPFADEWNMNEILGAYKKTIAENGDRVKYLYQHDMNQPIGKMTELYEDDKGLVFVAEIAKTQLGNDVVQLMKSGVITENSVGNPSSLF